MRIKITKKELEQMLQTINKNVSYQHAITLDITNGQAWVPSRYHDCVGELACYLGGNNMYTPSLSEKYILLPSG